MEAEQRKGKAKGHKNLFIHEIVFKIYFLKKILFIYFLERGKGREKEGEKHQCVVASHMPPTGDLASNPGMCLRLGIELATLWFTGLHSIH